MDLEAKKRELADMQAELVNLESRYSREQDNDTLGRQLDSLKNDITKLSGEIDILQNMDLLEKKYSNSEPINFYYVDSDGLSDYIELTSGDVNYDRAYQQQRDLLQLEYNHYNKLPLSYVVRDNRGFLEGVVNSGNDKYDEVYNRKKNELLNMNIIYTRKDIKSDDKQDEAQVVNVQKEDIENDGGYSAEHFDKTDNEAQEENLKMIQKNDLGEKYVDPGYRLLNADGQIIVVGDIPLEKKNKVFQNIAQDFGQSAVDNMKVFDTKTLVNILSKEKMYRLSDSDYYADMDAYGNIGILNNGKVIYVIESKNKSINGKKLKDLTSKKNISNKQKPLNKKVVETHIGNGMRFTPNNLNSEYVVFKKDGYLHLIGNFTSDWLRDNYNQVVGDFINDKDITSIKLWNRLEKGDTPLDGFDVKVRVNNDGSIKVIGNVDNLEYHNQILDNDLGERKEGKHFKDVDTEVMSEDAQNKKDDSGLDIIPNSPDLADLSNGAEKVEPIKGRKITRKEAKPSLIKRGIEKFKGLKKWQKIAIVAGVIAVVGVGLYVVGPQVANLINNLMNPENVNVANQVTQVTSSVQDTATQAAQSIDYSSIGGAGHTVFSNAADAANNVNGVISNQWFSNNPIDVFNTATNSYMGLTPEQLNDPNLLAELAKDPNNAMLFGNSINDPSGFIGLDDVVNNVTKIR